MARSKAYPTLDLRSCIERAQKIWDEHERKQMTMQEATQALGYKGVSGPSRSKISAMKQFGLFDEGVGGTLKLSKRAIDILHKPTDDPARIAAIKSAIHDVDVFARLLSTHADASVGAITSHLLTEDGFSKVGAKRAAETFLESLEFANGLGGDNLSLDTSLDGDADGSSVRAGDWVQWTSQGMAQFQKPRQIERIEEFEGEQYAIFKNPDGTESGAQVTQLSVEPEPRSGEDKPAGRKPSWMAPPSGGRNPTAGTKQATLPLDSGTVLVEWPSSLTQEDFEDIQAWLKILERKIGRSASEEVEDDD